MKRRKKVNSDFDEDCKHDYKKVGETKRYVQGWGYNIDYHYLCSNCGDTFSERVQNCN